MMRDADMCNQIRVKGAGNLRRRMLPILIAGCFGCGVAFANPAGPTVVTGQVSFVNQGNLLSITNSPGSIINWQNFSIAPGDITRFIQQNSSSTVLNRIIGQDPSQIFGALQSNGRVFLINPNGILFGQGAQVDVNGLVASTLNIGNDDFLAGKWNFKAGDKAGNLQNQGTITTPGGGQVYLIAPNVENNGIITSPKGEVILAAGHTVQLVDSANPDLHVAVSAPESQALNLGQIVANSGKVGIYGALINQRGIVNANSAVVGENGKIVFKASRDTMLEAGSKTTATGAGKGGDIHVLGDRVGLVGDANIDASGQTGGGTVLVGGDYQGVNAGIRNAEHTYFGKNAVIKADAIDSGDGGKVIVWADDTTRAYGHIFARGGAQSGNGGFVETSGKKNLAFDARVDTTAKNGNAGNVLLDPTTITIADGGPSGDDPELSDAEILFADTPAANFTITKAGLEAINAASNVTLEATGNITFSDFSSDTLTFAQGAGKTVTIHSSGGDIIATADVNDRIITSGANVVLTAGGDINIGGVKTGSASNGGSVTMNAGGNLVVREINTTPLATAMGGDINLTSSGFMSLGGGHIDARGFAATAGDVVLNSGGAINMQIAKTIYADTLKMNAVGGITDGQGTPGPVSTQIGSLNAFNSGSGSIRISSAGAPLSIVDIGTVGYGVKNLATGQGIYLTNGSGYTIGVNKTIISAGGPVEINGPGGVTFIASEPVTTSGGSVVISATDANAQINMPASSQISSAGGTIKLVADAMSFTGSSINAGSGAVTLFPGDVGTIIEMGQGVTDVSGAIGSRILGLTEAELKTVTTSSLLTIGGSTLTGNMGVMGLLDLTSGSGLTGTLLLNAGLANITVSQSLSAPATLVLNTSGGTISQLANKTISATALKARGGTVTLDQAANPVGVVAGSATSGDFKYRTANLLTVSTVDSYSGIDAGLNKIMLQSDIASGVGINQAGAAAIITAGGLAVKAIRPIVLTDTGNAFAKVAADITTGTGSLSLYSSGALDIDSIFGINGATTASSQAINITSGGVLSVKNAVNAGAGTGAIMLQGQSIQLGAGTAINGSTIGLRASLATTGVIATAAGAPPTVGGGGTTVDVAMEADNVDFSLASPTFNATHAIGYRTVSDNRSFATSAFSGAVFNAPYLVIGNDTAGDSTTTGNITVDAVINQTGKGVVLLAGGNISQTAAITAQELAAHAGSVSGTLGLVTLNSGNVVGTLAGKTNGGTFSFTNAATLNIGIVTDGTHAATGVVTNNGTASINTSTGNITVSSPINAGTNSVSLSATAGAISGGTIIGASLSANASSGITLSTQVGTLSASNTGANSNITISNTGILHIQSLTQPVVSTGSITVDNFGALTVDIGDGSTITSDAGPIMLIAHSPLTVNGEVSSVAGDITLFAGATGVPGAGDTLTIGTSGFVTSSSGNIILKAGDEIVIANATNVNTSTGTVTLIPNLNGTPLPTLEQCKIDPMLAGCSQVLPTLSQCTATPTLDGCTVVLPSLATCITNPATAGCTVVLPTLTACIADPKVAGCTVVLPSLATCITDPATAGCTVVLPALTACIADPAIAGCTVVLPALTACIADPAIAGCTVVLPTLAICVADPAVAGCAVVLPTLAICIADPAVAGCTVVLPTLTACIADPKVAGCAVVLPTLTACIADPKVAGCAVVLPALTACITDPAIVGCTVVLPTLATCVAKPVTAGCSVVLPTLAQCVAARTLAGCDAVLPTVSQCAAVPTQAGCAAVLPPITQTGASEPVAQAINTTINIINTSTVAVTDLATTGKDAGAGKDNKTSDSKKDEVKKDEKKKDDKKDTTGSDKIGAKNDDAAKKMYCN